MSQPDPGEEPEPSPEPLCEVCGQAHSPEENHCYTYAEDVDDDLICHICLQALVDPLDTPCGHTYCALCLTSFLVEKDFCPVDRLPLLLQHCRRSTLLVRKLLNKLPVTCPFAGHCAQVLPRCDLQQHLQTSCKGVSHYGLTKERKRRSQHGCPDGCASLTATTLSPEAATATSSPCAADEPGLDNPAYVCTVEDGPAANSVADTGHSNPVRARPFERCTIRSRSFKKINRALSALRRTKSGGGAVASPAGQGGDSSEDIAGPEAYPRLYHLIPDGEVTSVKITRAHPRESLSMRLVGGSETPLVHMVIQHIYRDGAIARDGRLLPGDIVLKVNGMDISSVPHNYALRLLRQPCQVLRLTVLREDKVRGRSSAQAPDARGPRDSFHVTLHKSSPEEQLGIKLVHKADEPGVFIFSVLDGGLADRHGQLQEDDRIVAVNGHDLRYGSPESAAHLIQASEKRVHLVVSRHVRQQSPDVCQEAGWNGGDGSHAHQPLHPAATCHEKVVSVQKDPSESLGMTVAGGASHGEWDLPIYIISVEPGGVISRDGRIKTGDILLNVNGTDLTEVSRSEAVALLKSTSSSVVLRVLEVREPEPQEEDSSPGALDASHDATPSGDWAPSWVMWLGLPRYLYHCKDVALRRNAAGSLGFCIVGGYEEHSGNKPFFIKSVVEGTPAYNDGRIRCGDILLAVNGRSTAGMTHACLARMLKELKGRITLTLVSWPGTFL
ncbi:E3 ubiquitin-protein ligase LNX isoform X1 [Oryctolagus cuniculus]|uniref:E3 ubiquitin-protein ligase LNX isoform X1 n=1 Tax=Oryctolagus cuniculus TaxID=9986 RepID=UPI0038792D8F